MIAAVLTWLSAHRSWGGPALALAAGVGIGWLFWHRPPQPAVHQTEDTARKADTAVKQDKDTAKDTQKDAGPTRKVVLEFDPHCPPAAPVRAGDPLPPSIIRQTVIETGPVQTVTRSTADVHTETEQHVAEQKHLELTIQPQASRQVQVGFEDVPGLISRRDLTSLRLAGRMRLFDTRWWAELSSEPLHRDEQGAWKPKLGLAAAVEF